MTRACDDFRLNDIVRKREAVTSDDLMLGVVTYVNPDAGKAQVTWNDGTLAMVELAELQHHHPAMSDEETGAPNLDAMPRDELRAFAKRIKEAPGIQAATLFPARPVGYLTATRDLRTYAEHKALAMSHRERGLIASALHYESYCESLYNRLPAFARW